jgi:phosphoribosylamine--glycine ligase
VAGRFGDAGNEIVIEELSAGRGQLHRDERRPACAADGLSQDHKRLRDGDAGRTPAAWVRTRPHPGDWLEVHARVMREVIEPTIRDWPPTACHSSGFLCRFDDRRQRRQR